MVSVRFLLTGDEPLRIGSEDGAGRGSPINARINVGSPGPVLFERGSCLAQQFRGHETGFA